MNGLDRLSYPDYDIFPRSSWNGYFVIPILQIEKWTTWDTFSEMWYGLPKDPD